MGAGTSKFAHYPSRLHSLGWLVDSVLTAKHDCKPSQIRSSVQDCPSPDLKNNREGKLYIKMIGGNQDFF